MGIRVERHKNVRTVYECPVCQLPFTRRGQVVEHGISRHGLGRDAAEELREKARRGYEELTSVIRWQE